MPTDYEPGVPATYYIGLCPPPINRERDSQYRPCWSAGACLTFTDANTAARCLMTALTRSDYASAINALVASGYTLFRSIGANGSAAFCGLVRPGDFFACVLYYSCNEPGRKIPGLKYYPIHPTVAYGWGRLAPLAIAKMRTHSIETAKHLGESFFACAELEALMG